MAAGLTGLSDITQRRRITDSSPLCGALCVPERFRAPASNMGAMEHSETETNTYDPAALSDATDLLGYLGRSGGTVPGGLTTGVGGVTP